MKVFWTDNTDELVDIHPLDPHGDGTGIDQLEDGDLFFVGNIDGFSIYRYEARADASSNNPPHCFTSPHPYTGSLYASFAKVNISLSLTGIDFSSTSDGTYDQATYPETCEFVDTLVTKKQIIYSMANRATAYENDQTYFQINSTTQSNWLEYSGNTDNIIWNATGIEPGQDLAYSTTNLEYVSGGQYIDATPYTRHSNGYHFPARKSLLYFISGLYSGTDPYNFHVRLFSYDDTTYQAITTEDTLSLSRANAGTSGYAGLMNICKITGEYAVFGMSRYTGSKPEQGAVEVIKINSDWTLTSEAIIDAPAPARYGNFGRYACFMTVTNDATYGTDLQLAVTEQGTESIYIFSQSRGWALHQTISFGRDDILMHLDGWGDYFVHWYRASGTSLDYCKGYTYNGTTWTEVCNQLIGTTATLIAFPNQTWSYNNSTTNYVYLYPYNGGTYLRRWAHSDMSDSQWMGPGPYLQIYDISPDFGRLYECGSSDMVFERSWSGITDSKGVIFNDTLDILVAMAGAGYSRPYTPQVISNYIIGKYIIQSNHADARWVISAGNQPNTGLITETLTQPTVWFAASFDGGTTWKFWNGSAIVTCVDPFSSTPPTTATMSAYTSIDEFIGAIDWVDMPDQTIDWLLRIEVTAADIPNGGELQTLRADQWELSNATVTFRTNYSSDHYILSAVVDPDYAVYQNIYDSPNNPYIHVNIAYFDDLA